MKKLLAISVFCLFFFSQFGKAISFCLCSVEAYQQTHAFHCDCEKQLVKTTEAENGKHQHAAALPQLDELYHRDNHTRFHCACFAPMTVHLHRHTARLHNGFHTNVFHPPGFSSLV